MTHPFLKLSLAKGWDFSKILADQRMDAEKPSLRWWKGSSSNVKDLIYAYRHIKTYKQISNQQKLRVHSPFLYIYKRI